MATRTLLTADDLLAKNPDTVRAPDVALVAREHLPNPRPKGYYTLPPDVAIEVLLPNDTFHEVQERIEAWLSAGAKSVWLVDPRPSGARRPSRRESTHWLRPSSAPRRG